MTLEEPDLATLDTVLNDAIERLRVRGVELEIRTRKNDLSPEEWRELLKRKAARAPAPDDSPIQ
jgi:hypothetical protein